MFTGIVEEVGRVLRVLPGARAGTIRIGARTVLEGTRIGDSIAVNGVCLTVVALGTDSFDADVTPATLSASSLGELKTDDPVNLERAMPADGRFGGHIVSGHIDGTGRIAEMRPEGNAVRMRIHAPQEILSLVVNRGSIAIDGVSLTVAALGAGDFTVSIIPQTGEETTLTRKHAGDIVNLENDVIGKYVARLTEARDAGNTQGAATGITEEFLARYGF